MGGDGAPWVKEGAKLLGGLYELDRFHLKRALHQGSANDPLVAQEKAGGDKRKEIRKLRAYLIECRSKPQQIPARQRMVSAEGQYRHKDDSDLVGAGLPALYGPHSGRPSVQMLRALAHRHVKI